MLACPLTASQMLELPPLAVYDRIVSVGRLAQKRGARLLGLGGLAAVLDDGGVTVAQRLSMPVTTGNSLTVATAVAVLGGSAEKRGLTLEESTAAVVGFSGPVGLACAEVLAPRVKKLIVVGRREIRVSQARAEAEAAGGSNVRMSTRIDDIIGADVILTVASVGEPLIEGRHLKKGAIVCDIAWPPSVSPKVRRERQDVAVIRGGILRVPGQVDLGFDLGLPAGHVYSCMAEAMVLALERRYESFSLGQRIQRAKVREIGELARKHGFRVLPGVTGKNVRVR